MGTTAYGDARRERNRRIKAAENAVAIAAVRWVEALDTVNHPGAEPLSVAAFAERQQDLIAATRRYSDEVQS